MKIAPQTTLNNWLIYPGSFMERLKEHGIQDAKVKVQQEVLQIPTAKEIAALQIPHNEPSWVREVIIANEAMTFMFARTVIPLETLTGNEAALLDLKDRSLGSFLFQDPNLVRSPFQIFSVEPGSYFFEKIRQQNILPQETVWGRTSVFETHHKKILLTEIFFPCEQLW